jgi:YjbE family integral membrane protein
VDLGTVAAYVQIISINVVLSGDNVVVIGMAAAGLPAELRSKAILSGIVVATVVRVVFALLGTALLKITGLQLAGGFLLLWVCWKMFTELRRELGRRRGEHAAEEAPSAGGAVVAVRKTLPQAITQIAVADVSMSLDNVLAVAGAAKQNVSALVFGLVLSVLLMGLAATLVAKLLDRYRWIAWLGLAMIFYVAVDMIYEGSLDLVV